MKSAPVLYQTPVKQVLSEYNKLTSQGFNCELLACSLENLQGVIQARGNVARVYNDYTLPEMDISWRMDKVAEDIKFGLTHDSSFFSPKNMARSSRQLGEMGYKNTELISIWLESVQQKLEQDGQAAFSAPPSFETEVYGSMKNFTPRYYIFQGFQNDQEFHDHLQTLLMFKQDQNNEKIQDSAAQETQLAMQRVIDAAKEIRDLQVEQQATIETLRQQFFKLQQAQNKHDFLKENKYLYYDMLELQDLLVKGGYLDPQEALLGAKESVQEQMKRASDVFYDLVLNFTPELLSPQYEAFYNAATANKPKLSDVQSEHQNDLKLGYLSDILTGLAEQAQSARRDVQDRDYPNELYEKLLMSEEINAGNEAVTEETKKYLQKHKTNHVLMEQSYLNGWRNFSKESAKIINRNFKKLILQENTIDGLCKGLRALSACKHEARQLRETITKNAVNLFVAGESDIQVQSAIDGLVGIANCAYTPIFTDKLIEKLIQSLDSERFTFSQTTELLNALALLASKEPKIVDSDLFQRLMSEVEVLEFQTTHNELTLKQFTQLHEVHQTLKFMNKPSFYNKNLNASLQAYNFTRNAYVESAAGHYDPLKDRVIAGLARGLQAGDLVKVKSQEDFNVAVADLVIKPDIMTGYKGDQLAIYVLNQRQFMHDTKAADGRTTHLLSLSSDLRPVTIPIDSVVDYDLQTFHLKIKEDFNINSLLGIKFDQPDYAYNKFSSFASILSHKITEESLSYEYDNFLNQLAEFFTLKSRLDYLHEPDQLLAANDELKFSLIKLALLHDQKLAPFEKAQVHSATQGGFAALIEDLRKSLNEQHKIWQQKKKDAQLDSRFDFSWQATRQSVELPVVDTNLKKAIEPELLSRKFLTFGNYHHYDDWKQLMTETFDQFSLMQINDTGIKINNDPADHNRKVPKGIFPLPNQKREILRPPGSKASESVRLNHTDRFTNFEADPHRYMLEKELEISKNLKELTPAVSLITNLQNIKQGLLADCSDKDLCSKVLLQLSFTDQLIIEHLSGSQESKAPLNLLPRDPSAFRKYMDIKPQQQSAFNQFYLKEGLKKGRSQQIYNEIQEMHAKDQFDGVQELSQELENILLKNYKENEDLQNLSSALENYVQVNVDLKSLGVLDHSLTNTTRNSSLTDAELLQRERCLGESRLIKAKILYKVHCDIKLSEQEMRYLKAWKEAMSSHSTLIEDCLVPARPSQLNLSKISNADYDVLNSLPRVQVDSKLHGSFALNDLVFELSQVLDNETVRAVELTCLQESMRSQWQLGQDFRLVSKRNKEIDNVIEQFEEWAWRASGQFTQREVENLKSMFKVGRGIDTFDRAYINQDLQSLEEFIRDSSSYDNRLQMLETWFIRKETEIKSRVNLPTPELQKSDKKLNEQVEAHYKPARELLVTKILSKGQKKHEYSDLTSKDLHSLVEGLCTRLNLFNSNYPVFMPHAVRAIMEHKNLTRSDRATLDTYCKIFKLDWRGDQAITNKDQFMVTNPIYLHEQDQTTLDLVGEISNKRVCDVLRGACQPYLPQLASKILQHN